MNDNNDIFSWIKGLMNEEFEKGFREGYAAAAGVNGDILETLQQLDSGKLRKQYDLGYKDGQDSIVLAVVDTINNIALKDKKEVKA